MRAVDLTSGGAGIYLPGHPRRTDESPPPQTREDAMTSSIVTVAALALALATTPVAHAASIANARAHKLAAPAAGPVTSGAPTMESFAVEGTGIRRIRATILMDAPIDRVREVVFDYARYPEFMPIYEKASVLWTTPAGARLVHMQLGGIVHLWMRVEIAPPVRSGAVETYAGRLVQGNVKAFRPRWELTSMGERTRVTVESFMDPDLPLVPSGLINSGAKDGVRDAIVALKARIEGRSASR
jgi:ribosome-associated toxin RatA of RatAB toxin-antitoxin module